MKARKIIFTALATVAGAALLAGCGGTSKEEYEKEVRGIGKDVSKEMDSFGDGQPQSSDLEDAEKTLDTAADKLDDVTPPDEVKDLHEDLIQALRDGGDSLGKMAPILDKATDDPTSLSEEDTEKMNDLGKDVQKLSERMEKITKGFKDKDYDLGLEDSNKD